MSMAKLRDKLSRKSGDGSVVNDAMSDNEGDWCCAGCKQSWPESEKTNQNCLGAVPAKDGFAGTAQNWKSRIFLCWGAMTYFGLVEIAPPKWPCS